MLKSLVEQVDNVQAHMDNISREVEMLKKNQSKTLGKNNNNSVTEMKNVFGKHISILDTAKERISELEEKSIKTHLIEMQREKR